MKKKILIIRTVYILLFCVIMYFAGRALRLFTPHGIRQAEALYVQPKNTIDVAMMGSSHIHCNIDPGILYKDFGIAAYDLSAAEQPMWVTYHYILEICKRQDPKVIVLDMFAPAAYGDDFKERWMADNLFGMRFSLNKLKMLYNTCSREQFNDYFPSFVGYHSEYEDITLKNLKKRIKRRSSANFKGYYGYDGTNDENDPPATYVTAKGELAPKTQEYLDKVISYTKENDILLILVVSPYQSEPEQEMIYNGLEDYAAEKGVIFINGNRHMDEIGIDIDTDFYDGSHLNIAGGAKYTDYLGNILKKTTDLPDRRGDERYSSWVQKEKK